MPKKVKNQKGITLITLVITIIILFIISSISISLLASDTGMISEAKKAKKEIDRQEIIEEIHQEIQLKMQMSDTSNLSSSELKDILEEYGYLSGSDSDNIVYRKIITDEGLEIEIKELWDEESGITLNPDDPIMNKPLISEIIPGQTAISKDKNYVDFNSKKTVKIPEGFTVSNKNGETEINGGLVVIAPDGCEYVWIPVDGIYKGTEQDKIDVNNMIPNSRVLLGRYVFTSDGKVDNTLSQSEPNAQLKTSATSSYYHIEGLKQSTTLNTHANNIEKFIESVEINGGFYIGKYEASKGEDNKALSIKSMGITTEGADKIQTKYLWNFITQSQASDACQNLYTGINSDLINSFAWDTALLFLQKNDNRTNKTTPYSQQTRLYTSLKNTGETGDVICNVHDMSGNCAEWTTETYNYPGYICTFRGGSFAYSDRCTRDRFHPGVKDFGSFYAFRAILYW